MNIPSAYLPHPPTAPHSTACYLPRDTAADEQNVDVDVGANLIVPELAEPKVLESMVAIGIVFAVSSENVFFEGRNLIVKAAKAVLRIEGKRDGNDLK